MRAAFLQSNDLERTVLMKPPKEFRVSDDVVWKIKKPVYGLNDGARQWLWLQMLVSSLSCEGHIAAVFLFLLWIVFVFIFIYLFIKMTNHLSP